MVKRVLLITDHFSPSGATASRRPGGLAKYLPEYGWEPIVVSRAWNRENCTYDPTIVPNLPADLRRYLIDCSGPFGVGGQMVEQAIRFGAPYLHPYSFLRIGRKVLKEVARQEQIDMIWTTAPQANLLELARYASRLWNKPWIADFRDVWQFIPNAFVRLTLERRLEHERHVVSSAAAISTVSRGFAQTLEARHRRSVAVIPHGYDPDLAPTVMPLRFPKFNIVYTGGVILGRPNFRPLLDAIGALVERQEIDEKDVVLEFFGAGNEERLREMFADHRYAHLVVNHGVKSHTEVIQRQQSAVLLLAAAFPGVTGCVTSKLFEYIVAGRPILAVPNDQDCVDEMLRETECGISCTTVEEIQQHLLRFYREWRGTGTVKHMPKTNIIARYSYRRLAEQVASMLDRCRGTVGEASDAE